MRFPFAQRGVSMIQPAQPWHVPVRLEDVPETGLHLDLAADEQVRAGLARLAGVVDMPRLEAVLDVVRHGNGLRATGRVSATVGQTCVVTLEPVENEVDEPIDVIFAPAAGDAEDLATGDSDADLAEADLDGEALDTESPEVLSNGMADVGALAAEFLLLGIDPYPRKQGVAFKPQAEQGATVSPFAALAKLKEAKH
jgi:predicted PhzF superfamily epimerase YddE/YHI9